MRLVEGKCNLEEMLQGLGPLLEAKIREKSIDFKMDVLLNHCWFLADGLRLNQVLVNVHVLEETLKKELL